MRRDITTDDVPEPDRFDLWSGAVFSTLTITAAPLPDAEGPFQARFAARSRGPLPHCAFNSDGFHASCQGGEFAYRQWNGYPLYREASAGVRFRIAGQEMLSTIGDLLVADALFEARPIDRYADESWLLPKALLEPYLPSGERRC